MSTPPSTGERSDLLASLRRHRGFLRQTVQDLTDEQAAQRTTISELTLGGLIKHVAQTEKTWADFMVNGPDPSHEIDWAAVDWSNPPPQVAAYADAHRMVQGDTLAALLATYDEVASHTDELVAELPDLDATHPLPTAPWFEAGASWSVRRVVLHIVAETSQHAGHADIIREALDGQKTMG